MSLQISEENLIIELECTICDSTEEHYFGTAMTQEELQETREELTSGVCKVCGQ